MLLLYLSAERKESNITKKKKRARLVSVNKLVTAVESILGINLGNSETRNRKK